jgi:hypothetical protein
MNLVMRCGSRPDARHGRHLHEVQVPQQADPQHAADHVQPAHGEGRPGHVELVIWPVAAPMTDDDDEQHDAGMTVSGRCENAPMIELPLSC